jgi:hypothetical protein
MIEYTMVIGVIVMVLMAMNIMVKRGIQGMIKVTADQIGNQENAEQQFDESGYLISSYSSMRASGDTHKTELGGVTSYIYDDETNSTTLTVSNLGFSEQE